MDDVHFPPRELEVMSVLWRRGSATVNEVKDDLEEPLAYTSVLSALQTLEETNDFAARVYGDVRGGHDNHSRLVEAMLGEGLDLVGQAGQAGGRVGVEPGDVRCIDCALLAREGGDGDDDRDERHRQ